MLLEPIYEQDFLDCSYGFRPKRSAHQALESFRNQLMDGRGGWVLEVDIRKFFDTLDHGHLRTFLQLRVRDGVLLRLIGKWLNAGVMEEGRVSYPDAGSPQGGVISPLLSNVFLHYVLDQWFEQEVKHRLRCHACLIRYADDVVIGFRDESDARRVMEVLPKRFGKYGLTIHPDKTQLIRSVAVFADESSSRSEASRDIRPAGLHPLLGAVYARLLGHQAEDGHGPIQPVGAERRLVVPEQPAHKDQRAATEVEREVTRSLRVLRCHGELGGVVALPVRGQNVLAEVALSPQPAALVDMERVLSPAPALSAGPGTHFTIQLPARSETMI